MGTILKVLIAFAFCKLNNYFWCLIC